MINSRQRAMSSKTTRPTTTTTSKVLRERQLQSNQVADNFAKSKSQRLIGSSSTQDQEKLTTMSCNKRKLAAQNRAIIKQDGQESDTNVYKRRRQAEEASIKLENDEIRESERYRIGDWVYCEIDAEQPYQIRRIEEFSRRGDGTYEARVRCAFRRSDIAPSLLANLEKRFSQHFTSIQSTLSFSSIKSDMTDEPSNFNTPLSLQPNSSDSLHQNEDDDDSDEETRKYNRRTIQFIQSLKPLQIYQLKHRELFYSRYYESNVPVSCFRGKITLDLFMPEVNWFGDYLLDKSVNSLSSNRFFYQICYDPNKNMISDDKMLIRVGAKFQADIPDVKRVTRVAGTQHQSNTTTERETLVWNGPTCHAQMGEICLNKYLKKVVETKLKLNETYQDCELTETRDIIKYNAMRLLHNYHYDRNKALSTFDCNLFKMSSDEKRLTASSINENIGSKLWTKSEMKYFEAGIHQFGKDFNQIKKNFLPNKPLTSIIEYYYNVYKITDDYIRKRDEKRQVKQDRLVEVKAAKYTTPPDQDQDGEADEVTETASTTSETVCVSCQKSTNNQSWLNTVFQQSYSQPVIKLVSNNTSQRGIMNDVAILDNSSASSSNTQFKLIDKPTTSNQNDLKLVFPVDYRPKEASTAAKLCQSCWIYWKKYGAFKYNYPESIQRNQMNSERMCPEKRRNKNQVYTCNIDECGREFTKKSEFCHHSTFTHCLLVKNIITQPPGYKQLNNFILQTSTATKTARKSLEPSFLTRLARNPCQLSIDYKSLTLRGDEKRKTASKRPYVRRKIVKANIPSIVKPPPPSETQLLSEVKVVRKRGRPRKNPIVEQVEIKSQSQPIQQQQQQQPLPYTCELPKCGKQFSRKKDLKQHTILVHALIVKSINAAEPRTYEDLKHFSLLTTPTTRAAISLCPRPLIKQIARNPFKEKLNMNRIEKIASGNPHKMKQRLKQMKRRDRRLESVKIRRMLRPRSMIEKTNNNTSNTNSPPSSKSSNMSSPHASLTNIVNRLETPPSKKGKREMPPNSKENTNMSVNLSPSSISSSSRSSISSSRSRTNLKLNYSNSSSSHHHHNQVNMAGVKSDGKIELVINLNQNLSTSSSSSSSRKRSCMNKGYEYSSDLECCLDEDDESNEMVLRLADSDDGDQNEENQLNGGVDVAVDCDKPNNIYLKNLEELNARINGTNSIEASHPTKTHGWYFKSNKDIKNTRTSMIQSRELKKMAMRPVNRSNSKLYDAIRSKTTLAAADAKVQLKEALFKCLELQSKLVKLN